MPEHTEQNREAVIDKILGLIPAKFSEAKKALLEKFIRVFYANLSLEDLQTYTINDLYGAALSQWHFIAKRKAGELKIRIYNPNYEEDGWSSSHTVIEFVHDDMPFIVDSMSMEINRLGYNIHLIVHLGGLRVTRDKNGEISKLYDLHENTDSNDKSIKVEAPVHIQVDRHTSQEDLNILEMNLRRVLGDVAVAVEDWHAMREQALAALKDMQSNKNLDLDEKEFAESKAFLRWMVEDHFTFLGCRDYTLVGKGDDLALAVVENSGLGVLRDNGEKKDLRYFRDMPGAVRELALSQQILLIAKSNTVSSVHRPAYTDYISVKLYSDDGKMIGERRFIGLFTSLAYHSNPDQIPFLRQKAESIMQRSGLSRRGHAYKELRNILEVFPRDDLFQSSVEELYQVCMGILRMQERSKIRLFLRKDIYGRFISALLYVPKDRYDNELQERFVKVFAETFNSGEVSFSAYFSESVLARIHFMIRIDPHQDIQYDIKALEDRLVTVSRSWQDHLRELLLDQFGEEVGNSLSLSYGRSFPAGYREMFSPRTAVADIQYMEATNNDNPLEMCFYQTLDVDSSILRFKLYQAHETTPLSDVLPVLENMGLRVIGEDPYEIVRKDGEIFWINNFSMQLNQDMSLDIHDIKEVFQDAFRNIWFANAESDQINYLVLSAKLSWRETSLLRAYARYLRQIGFTYSQTYIEETLASYPHISKKLIAYFYALFLPSADNKKSTLKQIEKELLDLFDSVDILDQDKILRQVYLVIKATLRTNFFQAQADGSAKNYIAFKFASEQVPELPLPKPKYEIFIYSPRFEGIHLRSAKVARGGLRWSDRREDFRTEILGLMKAQQVKNAVIVPQGAKGGFVAKHLPVNGDRDSVMAEVIECYKGFIRGLLDITDNLVEGQIVPPKDVVRYDEDDPYLVVAADKGTATFSDIANSIAHEYGFWLDDAFASGGSTGYDHKKMGITARGAWESVKHHFRILGIDTQNEAFSVVGIGDLAGDVFGNGMLLSKHIKLVAAFNHQHIFIDPDPDAAKSYQERERMFNLPRSSWEDYDAKLISKGGGIFKRSAKAIKLSPEIKKLLGVKKDIMVPNDLIKAILSAKVDLLWNGGIGTFVKAEHENHAEVGDRNNDAIRIDAGDLRVRVVGEGGNLGLTQLARIEFALNGGLINTDFIDNSAGVDCSDYEVNIKILLNDVVAKGDMTVKQRNELLAEMTDEVGELVLDDNYMQAQTVNVSMHHPSNTLDLYARYIEEQEHNGNLDRALEFLPDEETLLERKASGQGFTRPELCVLLAYSKNILKQEILDSDVPDGDFFVELLRDVFPKKLCELYWPQIKAHSLHREIIATYLSNNIVNYMGVPFIHRLRNETGADVTSIVRAFIIAHRVFDGHGLWDAICKLDYQVTTNTQVKMLLEAFRLIQRATRWFLRNRRRDLDIHSNVNYFAPGVMKLTNLLPNILTGIEKTEMEAAVKDYMAADVPERIAYRVGCGNAMFSALDLIETAKDNQIPLKELASVYFILGDQLELSWLRHQVRYHPIENLWDGLARSALRDDLDKQQCEIGVGVLQMHDANEHDIAEQVRAWIAENDAMFARWQSMLTELRASLPSFTMYLVAVRELAELTHDARQVYLECHQHIEKLNADQQDDKDKLKDKNKKNAA